jgi:hypothetical protein
VGDGGSEYRESRMVEKWERKEMRLKRLKHLKESFYT